MTGTETLSKATLILRVSVALFLLPWIIEKFTDPETTAKIFKAFYFVENLPLAGSYAVGAIWLALWLAFIAGFKKRISYGLVMLLHGIGTVTTWFKLLPWMESYNHLFLAAIPTLGAMIALYVLRDHDTIFTLDK